MEGSVLPMRSLERPRSWDDGARRTSQSLPSCAIGQLAHLLGLGSASWRAVVVTRTEREQRASELHALALAVRAALLLKPAGQRR
jgi:hypothetical protein